MAIFKCKMCGGDLEITDGLTVAECIYCGTQQTLPKANDEIVQNLFNRANNLRLKCEFDKAEQIYEKILQENDAESEAHWGIVLCKYGIEYVEDPKTYKRIPTCHRTSYDAVTTDADYLSAIKHADASQRSIYEAEAKAIDEIQKNILSIVKDEKPFDVFICYKETDENGKRTVDSSIANDIYYQLTQEGLKVFYAAITLEDKLGREYEPYIFAALNSAKVMLVIGTKPQYFTAVWVKNEWSRFLKLMKTDRSKLLIPCYKDMDAYDLPEEFAHLQAQDMSKIGFINDVVRGIKKVTVKDEPKPAVVTETVVTNTGNTNTAPLLKRAFMFLEDGDWDRADDFCEQVLNIDPECAQAYLGKLMAELKIKKQEGLKDCAEPFDGLNNYQKALRFADDGLKSALTGYIEHIVTRNENARLEGIYNKAHNTMFRATVESSFQEAAKLFASISQYKDAADLAEQCHEKAEIARKEAILTDGKAKMRREKIADYESAIKLFRSISGWKDADDLIVACNQKIEEIKAREEAEQLEQAHRWEQAQARAKRNKKIAALSAAALCLVIAFVIVLTTVIIPNNNYNKALALMEDGKYADAILAFEALDGYKDSNEMILECKYRSALALMDTGSIVEAYEALIALEGYEDSADKANSIYRKYMVEKLKAVKAGDYVFFGAYEQDNNTSNGKEDIEWLVLEVKDGKALVISKYALDCKPYNTSYTDVTWENCTLRKWLNNDFLGAAFSAEEKAMIPTVTVSADKNPDFRTNPGKATQDQVFLLSIPEANKYFNSDSARQCKPTDYAVAIGVYVNSSNCNCCWWLRSPGEYQGRAAYVYGDGDVAEYGGFVDIDIYAVRPALWIDLS